MTTYLLDANVLISLVVEEHEHHDRASGWAAGIDRFAVCPVVEGALVRFLVRLGESAAAAGSVLGAIRARPGYEFWPDSLSYADLAMPHVRGHRQVTDSYLVGLVRTHGSGRLATWDRGLAAAAPDVALLLPMH